MARQISGIVAVSGFLADGGVNQFLLDQPSDAQYDLLGQIATEVLPKLRREQPRPTSQGVTVNASTWHKPQDHVSN